MLSQRRLPKSYCTLWLATILLLPTTALAEEVLFFDDFSGPTLNPEFMALLPDGAPQGDGSGSCDYHGASDYSFESLDGASVLRMSNTLNNWQRRGWSTGTAFVVSDFRYEIRFNVLVQSPTTSIDSFIEAWMFDAADFGRYTFAGPSGQNYGLSRQFRSGGSIDGQYAKPSYGYADNAWYRLVIEGSSGQNIRASLFADDATTELVGRTFAYAATAFPDGFHIGLAQATGAPNGAYPLDVAVDWVRLTTTAVPEPAALILMALAAAGWSFGRYRSAQ